MKIGIISDTHDHLPNLRKSIDVFKTENIEYLIHAGDIVAPFNIPIIKSGNFKKCFAVFGNNDGEVLILKTKFSEIGEIAKAPFEFEIKTKRFLLLHEALPVSELKRLSYDIIIFGHTHSLVIEEGSPLIINPGECCGYVYETSTCVILDIDDMTTNVINL